MKPVDERDRFARMQELFSEALLRPAAERAAWVRTRALDAAMTAEVLRWLRHDRASDLQGELAQVAAGDRTTSPPEESGGRGSTLVPPAPTRVGPYALLDRIGSGGVGVAYRARRADLNNVVAAEILRQLLVRRFGPLAVEIETRLERAAARDLDAWSLRILDARTLDEIFAE